MARLIYECNQLSFNFSLPLDCPHYAQYCCNAHCCLINRYHREIWETWYFWFGIILICLFLMTTVFSYALSTCKRKQHNLIRIRNVSSAGGAEVLPVITTISGPGGIIQPMIQYKEKMASASGVLIGSDVLLEDFAGPLDPPYHAIQPVTIVRGSAPPQGYRQTTSYTELVLPPGYVDSDHKAQS